MRYKRPEKGFRPFCANPPLPNDDWPYHGRPHSGFNPQYGIKNPKYKRHIFIRRDQLLYDIDAQIQMVAMSRRKADGSEDERLTSATETFKAMFFRWIGKHVGIAKNKMQTFVVEKTVPTDMNGVPESDETDIELLMPDWWDDTIFDQLTQAVHDYVVNAVLQEYFTVTLTSKDPVTIDKGLMAESALFDVKKLSNSSKAGRIRKPFKPFG